MSLKLYDSQLFNDIENLDAHILEQLSNIKEQTAIAAVKLDLPPGEMFRMPGVEYGIYVKVTDVAGNTVVRGHRPGRGEEVGQAALQAAIMVMKAMGISDPMVHYFTHHIRHA